MNTGGHDLKLIPLIITALIFITTSISSATDWEYFMQDNNGDSHYIDLDSIKHTLSGTARMLRKVELSGHPEYVSLISDTEMDCKNKKIRILKETAFTKNGKNKTSQKDGKWQDVHSDDLNELLYELVCSLRRSKD